MPVALSRNGQGLGEHEKMVDESGLGSGREDQRRGAEKVRLLSRRFQSLLRFDFLRRVIFFLNFRRLVPPQRRDMWRNIIKHVQPKENVDLIKKSILLHKLQKRQKPLKVKHLSIDLKPIENIFRITN